MSYSPRYRKKKKSLVVRILDVTTVLFLALLLLGGGMFLYNTLQSKNDQDAFQQLASLVEAQTAPTTPKTPAQETPVEENAETEPTTPATTPYQVLYEQNQDFVAWVKVPGTKIDYPVMYTPEDIEYYIYRAFDGTDSPSGTPFVGDHGSLEDDRCVIYGHNMGDGTMFRDLENYAGKAFWEKNPTFTITTLTEERNYEIFAAVRTRVLKKDEEGVRYYRLEDGIEQWLKENSLYDTGITPGQEDSIVLLSTCSYHTEEGRFLVAGRLIPKD